MPVKAATSARLWLRQRWAARPEVRPLGLLMAILGISFWSVLRFCWLRVTHRNSHSAQQNGQIAEKRADQHHLRRRFVPEPRWREMDSNHRSLAKPWVPS